MASDDYRVQNGVHQRYIHESECEDCGEYWGDEYRTCSTFELTANGSHDYSTFFVVPLTQRETDETGTQSGTPSALREVREFGSLFEGIDLVRREGDDDEELS